MLLTTASAKPDFRAHPGTIAVSGAAGRFGGLVIRRLHRTDDVVSIDPRDFSHRPADVDHFETDLRRKDCRDIFRRDRVQAVIHLGPHHAEIKAAGHEISFASAIEDFTRLLEYCDCYQVNKLVLLSSADVYGARAHNPQFLTEEAPLLAADLSSLRDIDMLAQSFFWKRPDIETVILRPTHVSGGVNSIMARYLRLTPVPRLMGYDPMMQLVHEEDVVQAIRLALAPGHRGVFNVAGPPPLPLTRVLKRLGRSSLPVPLMVAKPIATRLNWLGRVDFRASYVDYLRYVCMVDDSRAREVLGYEPTHDLNETIAAVDLWE
ncbi:MAG: NAD-dependent epimerase/dehydratase family protein [Deltaproteobacteria bacterium]|nr:NAD-dependent epimerase/dehydratase family protein [Deltaproteobacteria bacterium]